MVYSGLLMNTTVKLTFGLILQKHHLTLEDKWIIKNGMKLTNKHINFSQSLIKQDFPLIQGLRLTLTQNSTSGLPANSIQAIHCKEDNTGSLLQI